MPRKESAGTLLWRVVESQLELLIVHASGGYNRSAPWNLAKGEVEPGEALEAAARRETLEETGVVAGELVSLGFIDYVKSKKRVHAFAGPAPEAAAPRCASWEIDRAEFVPANEARARLHPDLQIFVDRLLARLDVRGPG